MKKIITILLVILLSLSFVFAQENHENEIEEGRNLVKSSISCNDLTEEQLESIGEYYMEQMHPGESHEIMDNMMGGEGSESLKQGHINMARRLYCKDNTYIGYGMMGGNMMDSGMMGNYPGYYNSYSYFNITTVLINILLIVLIAGIIILLVKLLNKKERK